MINKFFILSERCSGSHFVEQAFFHNFHIDYLSKNHHRKHFFGHKDDIYSDDEVETTLFVCLIRDPIEWIDSMYKSQYHVPLENCKNIDCFLNNEWYSVYDANNHVIEIPEDRHMITSERYKNIFEMRKTKHDYILNKLKLRVKHMIILKYEDFRDDYVNTLDCIRYKFMLQCKSYEYKRILDYKGIQGITYYKKNISLSNEIVDLIKCSVDKEQERLLGYFY